MSEQIINLLITGTLDTLQMTIISTVMAMLLGIPLGVVLVVTSKGHILENVALNKVLGAIVNATRSVPFIILMVAIIPFTRMVVGTSIGTTAACVPLTIAAIPFLARLVETSIKDINFGVIEAAQSMGASPLQIIWKVLLPEALPTIIDNVTVLIVNLIGYSAMAGAIGGGGLGDIAIRYGYQRFQADIMIATIIILIVLVQVVQMIGDAWSKAMNKKEEDPMSINEKLRSQQNDELFTAILTLENTEECYAFFEDICTINELKALSQRLQVAKMLRAGDSYEKIVEETGASTATISRVKRCLVYGADGYTLALDRLGAK